MSVPQTNPGSQLSWRTTPSHNTVIMNGALALGEEVCGVEGRTQERAAESPERRGEEGKEEREGRWRGQKWRMMIMKMLWRPEEGNRKDDPETRSPPIAVHQRLTHTPSGSCISFTEVKGNSALNHSLIYDTVVACMG